MKYFAFISYNQADTVWGKRIQRKLEHYRMPATLCREHDWKSANPLKPVFFAPTDIQPGGLSDELKSRLSNSENLIVVCSPNSAQSEWVGREIAFFHSLGRTDHIHLFIVDGVPHSGDAATECFNPVFKELGMDEILGANIHEKIYKLPWLNVERAYIQLITKLLGVEFDTLWNRHKRLLIRQAIAWTVAVAIMLTLFAITVVRNRPVDVNINVSEATAVNRELPAIADATIALTLDNERKVEVLQSADGGVTFANIPAKMIGSEVRVVFAGRNYLPVDTIVRLERQMTLPIRRDADVYGRLRFKVYDRNCEPKEGVRVEIEGLSAVTDAEGYVEMRIPVERQRKTYRVFSDEPLVDTLLDAPCGESDALMLR